MEQPFEQEADSGPSTENPDQRSSPESPRKRTRSAKNKAEPPNNPLKTGSKSRNLSETGLENGSVNISRKKPVSEMPVPKPPLQTDRTADALRRLKVKPEALETAPQITPTLRQAKGGLNKVLAAMRLSGQDEVIAAFLRKYDSIPIGDRKTLPWEAIALSAGLNISHLLGSAMLALTAASANTSRIIAVTNHPFITKKRVEYGLLPSGEKDRNALDIMVGALPSAKGPTFIGKAIFGGGDSGISKDDDETETQEPTAVFGQDDDLDRLFPPSNTMQEKLVPIRQRLLEK